MKEKKYNLTTIGFFFILLICWFIVVAGSLIWTIDNKKKSVYEYATKEARAGFKKDVIYRHWAAAHGGTYVPVTQDTPPNPYLEHIAERDISTPSGRKLTLVNPAYMTRQVHELGKEKYDTKGHITSLNPIRPENRPDDWEVESLKSFENGAAEAVAVKMIDGEEHLRLMQPLIVKKSCLKCHAKQGYAEGDIRGGLSISIPLVQYKTIADKEIRHLMTIHGLIFLVGTIGLLGAGFLMNRKELDKIAAIDNLAESEEKYRTLIENTPAVSYRCLCDENWTMVLLGDEIEGLSGYPSHEFIDNKVRSFASVIHPGDKDSVNENVLAMIKQRKKFSLEYRIVRADGQIRWVLENGQGIADEKGELTHLDGLIIDITERKKIETALQDSEAKYRQVINTMTDALIIIGDDGNILFVNSSFCDLYQYAEYEAIGMHTSELIHSEYKHMFEQFMADIRKDGHFFGETEDLKKDGTTFFTEIKGSRIRFDGRECLLAVVRDVTKRKLAEKKSADSKQQLSDIIDFLPDPTFVIDVNGTTIAWNRAMERTSGIYKNDIVGKGDYAYALPFYGQRRPILIDLVLQRNKKLEKDYLSFKEKDGVFFQTESFHPSMGEKGRFFSSTATKLYDSHGEVVGAIESLRDITISKQTEHEREKLISELQEAIAKIKTLSGLVPICSNCKKIRDDKGYWSQLELYIQKHSDATFSHGMCPECADKLYGDQSWYIKMKKNKEYD